MAQTAADVRAAMYGNVPSVKAAKPKLPGSNTQGSGTGPVDETKIGDITIGGPGTPSTAPPPTGNQSSGQEVSFIEDPAAWVSEYYGDEWLNDDGTYNMGIQHQTGGNSNSGDNPLITGFSQTPETHPWLYPQEGQADTAGLTAAYGHRNPEFGGTSGGFGPIPKLSDAERRASYDANNFFRNGGVGMDPRLLRDEVTNVREDANSFQTSRGGTYNFMKGVGPENLLGKNSSYTGPGMDGSPVNYSDDRWGKVNDYIGDYPGRGMMEALATSSKFADFYKAMGINPQPPDPDRRPDQPSQRDLEAWGGSGQQNPFPSGTGGTGNPADIARSWQNMNQGGGGGQSGPGPSTPGPTGQTPEMGALTRALMKNWS